MVEVLAILLLLCLGAMVMVPALARTRPNSQGAQCLNNMRQLMTAMSMYTHENYELFPPNPDDANTLPGHNWCAGDVSSGMPIPPGMGGSPDMTNPDNLTTSYKCLLATYLGKNYRVFKCPADPRFGHYNGSDASRRGTTIPAVRSIAMNQGVGNICPGYASGGGHSGKPAITVRGPWLTGTHQNAYSAYATFGKTSEFVAARPSDIFIFADEDPYSINDASLAVIAKSPIIIDYPASFHGNACGFAFGDGHSELHQWQSGLMHLNGFPGQKPAGAPGTATYADWFWLASHATRSTVTGTVP